MAKVLRRALMDKENRLKVILIVRDFFERVTEFILLQSVAYAGILFGGGGVFNKFS